MGRKKERLSIIPFVMIQAWAKSPQGPKLLKGVYRGPRRTTREIALALRDYMDPDEFMD